MKTIDLCLAKNLKRLRESKKLTQAELAEQMDTSIPTIQNWESGRRWPRKTSLERLAQALGCTEADLLSDDDRISLTEIADQKTTMREALEKLAYPVLAQELHALRVRVREFETGKLGDLIAGYWSASPALRLVVLSLLSDKPEYGHALEIKFPRVYALFEHFQLEEVNTFRPARSAGAKK